MFITQSYFSVPKDVRLNSNYYLIMKINIKIELQNIAINHSTDIDYKDFVNIYRECTKELYSFTILPYQQVILWDLEEICFILIKMTVADQLKIIDKEVNANQYDLDRLTAKISAYSAGDLRKYVYLTGEDLGYKPSVVEQAKFDCSPLGNVFNKELTEEDKK